MPLHARALVLDDGATRIGIVSLETLVIFHRQTERLRRWAQSALGIHPDGLAVSCTHTHSGPEWNGLFATPAPEVEAGIMAGIQAALAQAVARLAPCRLAGGQGTCASVQVNRRRAEGTVDPTVSVVRMEGVDGRPIAVTAAFACHPIVLPSANVQYSGDWPGYAMATLEASYPGAVALLLQGCAGDINPVAFPGREMIIPVHDRAVAEGRVGPRNPDTAARIGRTVAAEVIRVAESLVAREAAGLACARKVVSLPMRPSEEVDQFLLYMHTPPEYGAWIRSLGGAFPTEAQVLRVGDRRLVCLPGEPLAEFAPAVRARLGAETLVLGYCNDDPRYVLPDAEYERAGLYETIATPLGRGTETALLAAVWDLAGKV